MYTTDVVVDGRGVLRQKFRAYFIGIQINGCMAVCVHLCVQSLLLGVGFNRVLCLGVYSQS